jgi:ribosome maturation factor RimP
VTDQQANERVRSVVEAPLSALGFEVVDVERQGSVLRVTVDLTFDLPVGAGDTGGIDLDGVTRATRVVSDLLDRHDLVGARTTLEVSSPGVERPLRTPAHFRRFLGTEVAVKLRAGVEGERRLTGVIEAADDDAVLVAGRRLAYADIERARTVFVWPASGQKGPARKVGAKKMGRAS